MIAKETLKVLLVDDHQMLIDGIKSLLRKEKHIAFCGECHDGIEALNFIEQNEVDLIITDINMPNMGGIELTQKVKKKFPTIKVLVLSMYNDKAIISEIIASEAEGYILKNTGKEELINAIEKITNNGTYYCNEVISVLMQNIKKEKTIEHVEHQLTPREIEIIKLITEEFTTNEIAEKLFISPRTVDTHRKNILEKTKSKTIVGLIKFAFANHLF
jgi:DNA-binding NarL/FixJ family response regulator